MTAKLKEVITTKLSRYVDRKEDRPGVESFYAARQYAPLFTDNGELNARGKAAIDYLRNVSADVQTQAVMEIAGAITPVPGGTGPTTVAVLAEQTLLAAERAHGR